MTKSSKSKETTTTTTEETKAVTPNDLGWTDYVLSLLSDDEKIMGNPTTDGLRRVFEIALNCKIISSTSHIAQSPDPSNEKRATVVHSISYCLNDPYLESKNLNIVSIDGSADVYWGNCDKIYRNHPVAVAETRAEGRALRRALKLRKVVAAEELANSIDDHPDGNNVSKISSNQINFIDVLSKRLNINTISLIKSLDIAFDTVYNISHEDAVSTIQTLSKYQQDMSSIPSEVLGYQDNWK
jgi:hypothetical protein